MFQSQDNTALKVFDPEASAALMKLRIKSYQRVTEEIVAELYRAKDFYSNRGHRSDLLTNDSKLNSFKAYLDDIGLYEVKAYRWLERYVPEENKLLTYEEFSEKKEADRLAKMSEEERDRSLRAEFRKTGVRPIGWSPQLEQAEQESQAAFVKQQERIDKLKEEQNRKAEDEKKRRESFTTPPKSDRLSDEKADYYYRLGKSVEDGLHNAAAQITTHTTARANWKEKIRLSDGGKEDAFMDAIIDYLEGLDNDSRRIEACNNLIKICRNIAVELQKNSVRN